jgi:UDP-N-acetylmuramoyl-tripeptide--D-alanyl-D-alanine ligase
MPTFDPDDLALWARGTWNHVPPQRIEGFSIDTRKIDKGELFVAIKDQRDGHEFLEVAERDGAGGALVSSRDDKLSFPQLLASDTLDSLQGIAEEYRKTFGGTVVGITGSCGKTSTKDVLGILLGSEVTHCTSGNLNNHLGVPLSLLGIELNQHKFAVIEAGINGRGEMQDLAKMIQPNIVLVTNIGSSHLAGLGNEAGVAREKAELFNPHPKLQKVIFPEKCLEHKEFTDFYQKSPSLCNVLRNGVPSEKDNSGDSYYEFRTETNTTGDSSTLRLWRDGFPVMTFPVPSLSDGMVSNIALALLASLEMGIDQKALFERLPQYSPSALRGTTLTGRGCTYFVDCYNANPTSMLDSISFFSSQYSTLPRLFVLGGMEELGEEEEKLHETLGSKIKLNENDLVLLIGQKASWMAKGILAAGGKDRQVLGLKDGSEAIPVIEDFRGAIFFKGSRALKLENLVPQWAVELKV